MKDSRSSEVSTETMLKLAQHSGLTYNQAKVFIARTTGGAGTKEFSDTDTDEVRRQNETAEQNKRSGFNTSH